MSDTTGRRGRPKGSGIDDGQRLAQIARMIAADPALKPTTAIRSMGVSDPSVIRRLRDKFNAVRNELMDELRSSAKASGHKRSGPSRAAAARSETGTNKEAVAPGAPRPAGETAARARSIAAAAAKPAARVSDHQAPAKTAKSKGAAGDSEPAKNPSASRQSGADDEGAPRERRAAATELPHSRDQRPSAFGQQDLYMSWMRAGLVATNMMLTAQAAIAREIVRTPYVSLALRQQMALGEWAVGLMPLGRRTPKTAS